MEKYLLTIQVVAPPVPGVFECEVCLAYVRVIVKMKKGKKSNRFPIQFSFSSNTQSLIRISKIDGICCKQIVNISSYLTP